MALTHDHPTTAKRRAARCSERFPAPLAGGRGALDVRSGRHALRSLRGGPDAGALGDHYALLADGACFTGDAVLGEGSVFISPYRGAMSGYLLSLTRLRLREDFNVICPGHGPPVWDAQAKLDEYLAHRVDRENRLIVALEKAGARSRNCSTPSGATCREPLLAAGDGHARGSPGQARRRSWAPEGVERPRFERRCREDGGEPAREEPAARSGRRRGSVAARPPRSTSHSPFPPIADYGFLSDCHTCALSASDGSIEWMCLPHFDSPSIFGSLLDRGAGSWRVGPYGMYVPAGRR